MHRPEFHTSPDFQGQIDTITNRSLSPANINTYADEALDDLVLVVQDATEQYNLRPTVDHERGIDQEHAALTYFGVDASGIETTLDHIAEQAEEIRELDSLIEQITVFTDRIIIPPDERELMTTPGERHLGPKRLIPRLKTILFAARNIFNIDLRNPGECTVVEGELSSTMIRKESYKLIVLKTLNRAVLVCDEEENATFVFDSEKLIEAGVEQTNLLGMTKDELKAFILQHPETGYRLKYTRHYTENVMSLLKTIPAPDAEIVTDPDGTRFLYAKNRAPRGFFSTRDMMKEWNVTHDMASQAIVAVAEELGEVPTHVFGNGSSGPIFTADQKATVRAWLETNEYLVEKAAPEEGTLYKISRDLRVGEPTLKQAIQALGEELGSPTRKRVGTSYSDVYSAAQRARMREWLIENKKIPRNPDVTLLSADQLVPLVGLSGPTLRKLIKEHAGRLAIETLGNRNLLPEPQLAVFRALLKELGYKIVDPPE